MPSYPWVRLPSLPELLSLPHSHALMSRLANKFIFWPGKDERWRIARECQEVYGIRDCVGVLNETHIPLETQFLGDKGAATHFGSALDSHIFSTANVWVKWKEYFSEIENQLDNKGGLHVPAFLQDAS